jgi:hypothetical protein
MALTAPGRRAEAIARWAWDDPQRRATDGLRQVRKLATATTGEKEISEVSDTALMLSRLAGTLAHGTVVAQSGITGQAVELGIWSEVRHPRGPHGRFAPGSGGKPLPSLVGHGRLPRPSAGSVHPAPPLPKRTAEVNEEIRQKFVASRKARTMAETASQQAAPKPLASHRAARRAVAAGRATPAVIAQERLSGTTPGSHSTSRTAMENHVADMQKAASALAASLGPQDEESHKQLASLIEAQSQLMRDMADRMSAIEKQEKLGRQQVLQTQRSLRQEALRAARAESDERARALKAESEERARSLEAEARQQEEEKRQESRAGMRDAVVTAGGAVIGGLLAIASFVAGVHGLSGVDTAAMQQVIVPLAAGVAGAAAPALGVASRLRKKARATQHASDGLDGVRAMVTRELAKALAARGADVLTATSLARDIVAAAV